MVSSSAAVFLGQAPILVAMPYLFWRLPVVRLLLPLVVVQILMGIALGPSLLGRIFPASAGLLEQPALATLSGLAWLAVVLFAFLTGLHFDIAETAGRKRAFLLISLSSIAVPAGLGLVAGMTLSSLAPDLAGPAAGPVLFACAVAVATAVTALPVLGAICAKPACWHSASAAMPWAAPRSTTCCCGSCWRRCCRWRRRKPWMPASSSASASA